MEPTIRLTSFLLVLVVIWELLAPRRLLTVSNGLCWFSNFGFNLPWWDRLLGTYRAQPAAGHEGMAIGLRQFQSNRRQTLAWLLLVPFRGKPGDYAINRRKYGK